MENITVIYVSPEIVPYKATGGLADVAEALPTSLQKEKINTIRIMPKYKGIEEKFKLTKEISFIVETGKKANIANIYKTVDSNNMITYFISSEEYFERENCYGYDDDDMRFGFFCKAALELLLIIDLKPNIIHLNDWQTALISLFLKNEYSTLDFYKNIKTVFTIHNLQYQGIFNINSLYNLNMSNKYFNKEELEYFGKVSFMKAGIIYSDLITTVSKTYAKEIQTSEFGYGLDGLLRKYKNKIVGILNGIYYSKYDPEIDPALYSNYSYKNFKVGKIENKKKLQQELKLPVKDVPMMGVVSRLAEQKGINLIIEAIKQLITEDIQFVILGSGDKEYEKTLINLSDTNKDKISVTVEFNQQLARRIYAASDIFLMPSLFEPCGLSQLYSIRYGSIPIVRGTGGLLDTITDYTENTIKGNGFVFKNYNSKEFIEKIKESLQIYENENKWNDLVVNAMKMRFSWKSSAKAYIKKYNEITSNKN